MLSLRVVQSKMKVIFYFLVINRVLIGLILVINRVKSEN